MCFTLLYILLLDSPVVSPISVFLIAIADVLKAPNVPDAPNTLNIPASTSSFISLLASSVVSSGFVLVIASPNLPAFSFTSGVFLLSILLILF